MSYIQNPNNLARYTDPSKVLDPAQARRSFGHHLARFVRPNELAPLRDAVHRLLTTCGPDHPAVAASLQGLDDFYLDTAICARLCGEDWANAKVRADEVAMIEDGAKPLDVLAAVAGAWLWSQGHPESVPDLRAVQFLLSRAAMFTVQRPRVPGSKAISAPPQCAIEWIGRELPGYIKDVLELVEPLADMSQPSKVEAPPIDHTEQLPPTPDHQ